MLGEVSWNSIKIEFFYIILYLVQRKFYNFKPLDCDTVRNVILNSNFFQQILLELLNSYFNQLEQTQILYYELECSSNAFWPILIPPI